jgi:hypothetical protein
LLVHWFAMLAEVKLHNDDPGLGLKTDYSQRARVTKRGRISEEFKYETTVAKIQRGETSSARVGVRSSGSGVSTSAGMAWEEAFILGQNAADLLSLTPSTYASQKTRVALARQLRIPCCIFVGKLLRTWHQCGHLRSVLLPKGPQLV